MPEITREQIEAYRDSPSRLVTDFDREMARACLAALDRAEAAEQLCDTLTDEGGALAVAAQEARAEIAKLVSADRDTRAELEQCMADGRKRTAEVADLRSQLAACAEESDARPCEGCARPSVTTDSEGVPLCHECFVGCIYDDVVKPLRAEAARLKDKFVSLAGALAMIAQQNVQGTQEWQAGVEYMQETARAALENHKEVQP